MIRHKQGDVREYDNRVFWAYCVSSKDGEQWITRAQYDAKKAKQKAFASKWRKAHKAQISEYNRKHIAAFKARKRTGETPEARKLATAQRIRDAHFAKKLQSLDRKESTIERQKLRAQEREQAKAQRKAARAIESLARKERSKLMRAIRHRLQVAYNRATIAQKPLRNQSDREGIAWLQFLATLKGVPADRKGWHIDHVIPLALWDAEPRAYGPNAPENLQWLPSKTNSAKKDRAPTPEYLAAHLALVECWRQL